MTEERIIPNIKAVNWTFLLMTVLLLTGSILLQPIIGLGMNIWVNELVWILGLVLIVSWKKGYSYQETLKLRKSEGFTLSLSALIGFTIWFPSMFIYTIIEKIISNNIGIIDIDIEIPLNSPVQAVFTIIGMVVLAPICEELFFRGFMQGAYEKYNRKYSWIIVGILFGFFHISNSISNVISATLLGLIMGYVMLLTNSIWAPIVLHAFNNLTAILFGGISLIISETDKIPVWFIIVLLLCTILAITFLLILKKKYSKEGEPAENDIREEEEAGGRGKFIGIWIVVVIFILIGFLEISMRIVDLDTIDLENFNTGYSIITNDM